MLLFSIKVYYIFTCYLWTVKASSLIMLHSNLFAYAVKYCVFTLCVKIKYYVLFMNNFNTNKALHKAAKKVKLSVRLFCYCFCGIIVLRK